MLRVLKILFRSFALITLTTILLSGFTNQTRAQDANFLFETQAENEPTDVYGRPCSESFTSFERAAFSTVPAIECINESLDVVEVTFHGLSLLEGDNVAICSGHNDCFKEEGTDKIKYVKGVRNLGTPELSNNPAATVSGNITIEVCGDHEDKVKFECRGVEKDYFHGGNAYAFSIGVFEDDEYYPLSKAGFYVGRAYPEVTISPFQDLAPGGSISVTVAGGFKGGGDPRNNYQISVKGPGLDGNPKCGTIKDINSSINETFGPLRTGKYTITVKDQDKDSRSLNIRGIEFKSGGLLNADCSGGFTYYSATCNVSLDGGTCEGVDENGKILTKDPKGEEYREFIKQLEILNGTTNGYSFPCGETSMQTPNDGPCLDLQTAIGTISATPTGFIKNIFGFVLTIASFGAILVIIYAGYVFMTSRGDKEKVQAARETITAAVVGLLFIILSLVILEIIGVDILAIPGFGRE